MARRTKTTILDVAVRAKVSVATVSRVLNAQGNVDPDLTARVVDAIKVLDFRANRLARNFRKSSSKFIALIVPDMKNSFFAAVSREIEEQAFRLGYALLICNTSDNLERERKYFELLSAEGVEGIIVCAANEHQAHEEVNRAVIHGVAIVAIDRRLENAAVDLVLSDNFGGARAAASHLIAMGHSRIAIIAGGDNFAPGRERRVGFEQAMRDHGLPIDPLYVKVTNFREGGAETATRELWALEDPPTAIFVGSGNQAIGVLRALNALGARIPDDVSVVVFDDNDWGTAFHPPITAIEQNCAQIGATAIAMLMRRIENADVAAEERRIPTRLHVRESCKRVARPPTSGRSARQRPRVANGVG